eukprot:1241649-Rhodomonas_salina.1
MQLTVGRRDPRVVRVQSLTLGVRPTFVALRVALGGRDPLSWRMRCPVLTYIEPRSPPSVLRNLDALSGSP